MTAIIVTALVSIIVSVGVSTAIITKIAVAILRHSIDMLMKELEEDHNERLQFCKRISRVLENIGL